MHVHQEFQVMAQGQHDYELPAFPINTPNHGTCLVIGAQEGAIYLTKAQAMAFFNLVDPMQIWE